MNNKQVAAGRKALFPFADRVKLTMTREGEVTTLTPYLSADPETTGTPVEVVNNVTDATSITRQLSQSIGALLG